MQSTITHPAMSRRRAGTFAALVASFLMALPAAAVAEGVTLEWLTWSFFRITSPTGKVILTNPWATNPDSKVTLDDIDRADIILVPTGHGDEVGETVEFARKTGAKVVTTWEMAGGAFKGKIANEQLVRTQPGSTVTIDGIRIRVVNSLHGTGGANALYGGPAIGFFITFENGYTLYFSGSTDITTDMRLWAELFRPDAAILYYSSAMHPRDVAQMVRLLAAGHPALATVVPHHHRLKPPPGRSPDDLARAMADLGLKARLLNPEPGKVYTLTE